jgi:hypothetical protein
MAAVLRKVCNKDIASNRVAIDVVSAERDLPRFLRTFSSRPQQHNDFCTHAEPGIFESADYIV